VRVRPGAVAGRAHARAPRAASHGHRMSDEPDRREQRGPERPRASSRYSLYVGMAFLAVIVIATVNAFNNDSGGLLGADSAQVGEALAEFAVPELVGGADADANIFQDDCSTSENPCPPDERRTPACEVDEPHVIRVCDLFDRPSVISFWFQTPAECPPTQDAVDAAARRWRGRVNFLSIAIRGERDELVRIVTERGWTMPVGWDRDGAVSNLYRVGVCPTLAFVRPGGVLEAAKIGSDELSAAQLDEDLRDLVADARRRARTPR